MVLRYCPHCGNKLDRPDYRYCPKCGYPLYKYKEFLEQKEKQQMEASPITGEQGPAPSMKEEEKELFTNLTQNNMFLQNNSTITQQDLMRQPFFWGPRAQQTTKAFSLKTFSQYKKFILYYFSGVLLGMFLRFLLISDSFPDLRSLYDVLLISAYVTISVVLAFFYNLKMLPPKITPEVEKEHAFQVALASTFLLGYTPDILELKKEKLPEKIIGNFYYRFVIILFSIGTMFILYSLIYHPNSSSLISFFFGFSSEFLSVPFNVGETLIANAFILNLESIGFGKSIKSVHSRTSSFIRLGSLVIILVAVYMFIPNLFSIT